MPDFEITDRQTGESLTITADREPSQDDVAEIFASRPKAKAPTDLSGVKLDPYEQARMAGTMPVQAGATTGPAHPEELSDLPKAALGLASIPGAVLEPIATAASDMASDFLRRTGIDPSAQPGKPIINIPKVPLAPLAYLALSGVPELREGIEKGAGEVLSGFTEPGQAFLLPASMYSKPLGLLYGASMLGGVPASIQEAVQSKTPEELGTAIAKGTAQGVMGAGIIAPKIRPAIRRMDGKVVEGKAGETHNEIIKENELKPQDIDRREFVDQKGNELSREQAAAVTQLPTETQPGKLHSTDLPEAKVVEATGFTPEELTEAAQGEPAKPKEIKFPISNEQKIQLRQLGLADADISDLQTGTASVRDIVERKLQPFEGGGGPDHAKALEDARLQAIEQIESITKPAKPYIVAGKLSPDGEIIVAREHRAFEQEGAPGQSGYVVVPATVDEMMFERDLVTLSPKEAQKQGIQFVSIPEAQAAKGDIELAAKQKLAAKPPPSEPGKAAIPKSAEDFLSLTPEEQKIITQRVMPMRANRVQGNQESPYEVERRFQIIAPRGKKESDSQFQKRRTENLAYARQQALARAQIILDESAKSPVAEPKGTEATTPPPAAVAGEEGTAPGTVTAAPGTASQSAAPAGAEAAIRKTKPGAQKEQVPDVDLEYKAPATGKKSRWVKKDGLWYKAKNLSGDPVLQKTPLESEIGLAKALDEQAANPKPWQRVRVVQPRPELGTGETQIRSYGDKYISEHGIEAAQKRLDYINGEIYGGKRTSREITNLADEAENIRKAIERAKPGAGEAQAVPPSKGGELQMTILPGVKEFVEQDLIPALQKGAVALRETAQQARNALAPPAAGPEAKTAAGIIREHRGKLAQEDLQAREKFDQAKREMDSWTPAQSLAFIDRVETGARQPTPEAQALATALRAEFDRRVADVRALGTGKLQHVIADYFPHLWKDVTAAVSWYAKILGRRPLRGPASFLLHRKIPTTADGVAAGLVPVSWNPIELSLLKLHEMDRYVMGQRIFQEFKDKGLAKFSRSDIPPDGFARIDDRIANVVQYRPTTTAAGKKGAPERILRGHWYVQKDAARVLNNFLSPGLERYAWYRALRWVGNTMNMAQLGLSGYHFMFTMIDSGTSKLSLGIEQAAQGKGKSAITMARGVGGLPLANQLEAYYKGSKVLQEYTKPGSVGGDYAKVVDALLAAGGRTEMPKIFKNSSLENFFTALRSGNYPGAALRAPFAGIEAASYPLMQNIVPRLKLGVFNDMALHEIERLGPGATRDQFRLSMGKIWDSVDNRMGELVYDNLFWNRTLKDLSFLAVRAVGWNLGTIRELGGGVLDSATFVKRLKAGDPVVTKRMAYLVSLPITVGLMGAMYQKLRTGQNPQDLRDYFFPKTGKTLPDGTEERVDFPSYLKDMESYKSAPVGTLINKMHPLWGSLHEMYRNKDYYGTQIRNPDDPLLEQVKQELRYVAGRYVPFSVKGAQRRVGAPQEKETIAESFFGIMPIPAHIARSAAQNKIMEYGLKRMPEGARTLEEAQRLEFKRDLEKQIQSPADYSKAQQELAKAMRRGQLSRGQMLYENRKLSFERGQIGAGRTKAEAQWLWRFRNLSLEEAERVFALATPREKEVFKRDLLIKRARNRMSAP